MKRPILSKRYTPCLRFFLADMPPVKFLTTFYVEEELSMTRLSCTAATISVQCGVTSAKGLARSRECVSSRDRLDRARDATQRRAGRRRPGTSPAISRSTRSDDEGGYTSC